MLRIRQTMVCLGQRQWWWWWWSGWWWRTMWQVLLKPFSSFSSCHVSSDRGNCRATNCRTPTVENEITINEKKEMPIPILKGKIFTVRKSSKSFACTIVLIFRFPFCTLIRQRVSVELSWLAVGSCWVTLDDFTCFIEFAFPFLTIKTSFLGGFSLNRFNVRYMEPPFSRLKLNMRVSSLKNCVGDERKRGKEIWFGFRKWTLWARDTVVTQNLLCGYFRWASWQLSFVFGGEGEIADRWRRKLCLSWLAESFLDTKCIMYMCTCGSIVVNEQTTGMKNRKCDRRAERELIAPATFQVRRRKRKQKEDTCIKFAVVTARRHFWIYEIKLFSSFNIKT